jgi:hypothetical protein
MPRRTLAALCLAAALGGCATLGGGGERREEPEFVGRSMRVVAANGQASTMRFHEDGRVDAQFGKREVQGRWSLEPRQLCFTWAGNYRECWPYTKPFERGRTVGVKSDRGNIVRVTLE